MSKQLYVLCFVAIAICSIQLSAQNTSFDKIVPGNELTATPDVMAFHKYNSLPVSLYTGKVDVNLPLYKIVSGNMSVPISLSYNTGGIKVDDIASNVGLGWNLNASGSIIKIIKDMDDQESKSGAISDYDFDYGSETCSFYTKKGYFKDYIEDTTGSVISCQDYTEWAEEDASPDVFMASGPGFSSKFILEKTTTNYNIIPIDGSGVINTEPITRGDSNVAPLGFYGNELGFPENDNLWNNNVFTIQKYLSFKLLNTNGIKYTFDKADLKESLSRNDIYTVLNRHRFYRRSIGAHHLTQMQDLATGLSIHFNYDSYQKTTVQHERSVVDDALTNHANINQSNIIFAHIPRFNNSYSTTQNQQDENLFKSTLNYTKHTQAHRLEEIVYEQGKVEFKYDLNRLDTYDEKALTQIIVRDHNNTIIKKFMFDYDYFISKENCNQPECKRLRLLKIRQIGNDNTSIDLYTFSYNYTNPLPKVNSLQQDFLGYYNNNGVTTPIVNTSNFSTKTPILYYRKNQGKNAILPFSTHTNAQVIPGDFSLTPNADYSLSGILKSIQYDTGAKLEFEYETHRFNFEGNEYQAGGARIKQQTITDENQNVRVINYSYKHDNGTSSGYINNLPVYGYPYAWNYQSTNNNVSFAVFDKARTAIELTDGSFVGYAQVTQKEIGNGSTTHTFTAPNSHPNIPETYVSGDSYGSINGPLAQQGLTFLRNNSAFPNSHYIDNDILRGKLLKLDIRDDNNNLLKRIQNEYSKTVFTTIDLNYRDVLDNDKTDNQAGTIGLWRLFHSSKLHIERNLHTKTTTTEFLNGQPVTTEEFYTYDNNYPFLKTYRKVRGLSEIKTETIYPFDNEVSSQNFITNLNNDHRLSEPIKQVISRNTNIVSVSEKKYDSFDNLILPKSISTSKDAIHFDEDTQITLRDDKGNILEYQSKDGTYYSTVWGYHKQYPILNVKGLRYDQISSFLNLQYNQPLSYVIALSNTETNTSSEANLKLWLNQLREAIYSQSTHQTEVTTYTYDPLIGMTSITDPRGQTQYYEYDAFNRLKRVKDAQGHIISEHNYHYKSQN